MPWFRVDDGFHSHPKRLSVTLAAVGLWTVAGSWSSAHLTDGAVPDAYLESLSPDAPMLAGELVAAGLWKRRKGGYQFHDWQKKNPTKEAVENERNAAAERQRRRRKALMSRRDSQGDSRSDNGVSHTTPARRAGSTKERTPSPSRDAARASPPGSPAVADPWCGKCNRKTHMREDAEGRPYYCPECHPRAWQAASAR